MCNKTLFFSPNINSDDVVSKIRYATELEFLGPILISTKDESRGVLSTPFLFLSILSPPSLYS
jgi:hypothetical protein